MTNNVREITQILSVDAAHFVTIENRIISVLLSVDILPGTGPTATSLASSLTMVIDGGQTLTGQFPVMGSATSINECHNEFNEIENQSINF